MPDFRRLPLALAALLAGPPLAAHPNPSVVLDPANRYSLEDAVQRPDGRKVLILKFRLAGGGGKSWVTESCNPVMPVVNGDAVVLKQCFTNFYDRQVLRRGRGETLTFEWPVDSAAAPLQPDHAYRLAVSVASDCRRQTPGPGLFALGECSVTRTARSPLFRMKNEPAPPAPPVVTLDPGNRYSLGAAESRPGGLRVLVLKVRLSGGGGKTWVTESCNPVMPVVDGKPVAVNPCFTNFYSHKLLDHGVGETQTYEWAVDSPVAPLQSGRGYQLGVSLAADCTRTSGPGLYAMGDCITTRVALSPAFQITD